jgi:hypothetical protein
MVAHAQGTAKKRLGARLVESSVCEVFAGLGSRLAMPDLIASFVGKLVNGPTTEEFHVAPFRTIVPNFVAKLVVAI